MAHFRMDSSSWEGERMRKLVDRILRYWIYFKRGHGTYLIFLVSFMNFITIQYTLLISKFTFLSLVFRDLIIFAISFLIVYIPLATIIGWLDIKRGAVPREFKISYSVSEWHKDVTRALYYLSQKKYEEARKILERWVK